MKNKENNKFIAINTQNFLWLFITVLLAALSVICFIEGTVVMGVIFALLAAIGALVIVISAVYYVFTDEGVTIVYLLGDKEMIQWGSVRSVTCFGSWLSKGAGSPHYYLAYGYDDVRKFYVNSEIAKTMKTKKLMEIYCHDKIKNSKK